VSNTQSNIIVIPVAQLENANRLWVAQGLDGSPLPGNSFTIELGEAEEGPVTHVALATWSTLEKSNEFLTMPAGGGTLPTLTMALAEVGLTEQQAIDVCASIDPWCRTGGSPVELFNSMLSGRGLVRVF